jgi:hypothetical protein
MNAIPEIASFWKGRVLVEYSFEKTLKPILKIDKCPDDAIKNANELFS